MPAPEASPPPPRRAFRFRAALGAFALVLLLLALLLGGAGLWLVHSESGLPTAARLAEHLTGGRLRLMPAEGRLTGPLHLREAAWRDGDLAVTARDLVLDWQPAALRDGRLDIARLQAAELDIRTPPSPPDQPPPKKPASLRLPLAVHVGELALGRLTKGELLLAEEIRAGFDSDGAVHTLTNFQARRESIALRGDARLQGDPPFALEARLQGSGQVKEHPLALVLTARGPLERIDIAGQSDGSLRGPLSALVTPFAPQPVERLQARLTGIDPAAWVAGAPAARLDLEADLKPRLGATPAIGGQFTVTNRTPARLDARGIPVTRLAGKVDWQGPNAVFTDLAAGLLGGGTLAGRGRLGGRRLDLELAARGIDAAALHSRLQPTRLAGPLSLHLEPERQSFVADLTDPRFKLAARVERQGERVEVSSLRLGATDAYLEAHGHLDLGRDKRFKARGRLAGFDPSRFAKVPAARLNADFDTAGRLQPHLAGTVHFDLHDSRFNGQPLVGKGTVDLDWPAVRKADVELAAGPNRLQARGAFGRPGDSLLVDIDAPRLAPYGIDGDVKGKLRFSGTLENPAADGRLESTRLALPQGLRLRGLRLDATVGARPRDPLRIDFALAGADTPDRLDAARDVSLLVEGSRASHSLRAKALLNGRDRLALAAAGGLAGTGGNMLWSGELRELAFEPTETARALRLVRPSPLRLGREGWSLGPARLAGEEWQGTLAASAADGRLRARAEGGGPRLGQVAATLDARLLTPWQLDAAAPWRGSLDLAVKDLGWVGDLLGPDWKTFGRLQGHLDLAGTPRRPRARGDIQGDGLGLRLLSQGLHLENGRLRASLEDDRLHIATLNFDSPLRPPPRALAQAARSELERIAAAPGRLEAQGNILLSPEAGQEEAALDFRLERAGVIQEPDRWITLSGQGRLRWRESSLGLDGQLKVDGGYWELARPDLPTLSDDVVIRKSKQAPATPQKTSHLNLDLDLAADMGPHFHFRGAGLESRLEGSVRLKARGRGAPRATGTIQTVAGRFDAYGQQLAIERGIITFQGLLDNPALNVRAMRRGLSVDVGVEVTGMVKKPVVRLVSEPEMPEAEKLSWLVLGHGSEQIGAGDASVLLGAAGSLFGRSPAGGGIVQQIQQRFGLEELGVRQGQVGQAGGRQPTSVVAGGSGFSGPNTTTAGQIVTVGKRLSSNVVLSYEQALGRTENIVKLTVNLSRRLSLVGYTGTDNAVDLFYTFTFGR